MTDQSREEFDKWWFSCGSGIVPLLGHDLEEHSRRIAYLSWQAARQAKPDTIFQCDDTPINKAYEG